MTQDCSVQKSFLAFVGMLAFWLMLASGHVNAAEPVLNFNTKEQAALYLELTKAHRCLKCQNQNLADSNAGIAEDLKREIYQRVLRGDTGESISQYLVTRYGDFVLYKPPFKSTTYLLWIGPFLLLFGGLWFALRISRQSDKRRIQPDDETLAKARKLLDD